MRAVMQQVLWIAVVCACAAPRAPAAPDRVDALAHEIDATGVVVAIAHGDRIDTRA